MKSMTRAEKEQRAADDRFIEAQKEAAREADKLPWSVIINQS